MVVTETRTPISAPPLAVVRESIFAIPASSGTNSEKQPT